MKQKTVMMIGGGVQQVQAVHTAQAMGLRIVVTDRNSDAPCFQFADFPVVVDGRDIEGLIAYTLLNKERLNIAGVFTLTELVTSVAAVALGAGLPGVSLQAAVACQNKKLCKKIWESTVIPTPKGGAVITSNEAMKLFNELGQKVFVKPVVGFGGMNSQKILSRDSLENFFCDNKQEIIMEELQEGSMHDVNAVFDSEGRFIPLGCFDRFFSEQYPIETGAVYPSSLITERVQKAYDLTENAARALGIHWGPIKSDLVLSKQGFLILEISTRLHGPKGSLYLSAMVDQQNHLERILDVLTGHGTITHAEEELKQVGVAAYEIIDHPGRAFTKIKGIDFLETQGIEVLILNDSASDTGYPDNTGAIGFLFGKGEEVARLQEDLCRAKRNIHFE